MELIYQWIQKYKNIENQGFAFSPRYLCSYDQKNNVLKIEKNIDFVPNLFGKKINVTAIVGRNGSGKSSLLKVLEDGHEFLEATKFLIYEFEGAYYCEYENVKPEITSSMEVTYLKKSDLSRREHYFVPKIKRVASAEPIGEDGLAHYYFGIYTGFGFEFSRGRRNSYNMIDARFFVPRYVNIILDDLEFCTQLKQMYVFDTLRLILKNNSTSHIRQWINDEVDSFKNRARYDGYQKSHKHTKSRVCIYEENERTIENVQKGLRVPFSDVEVHIYDTKREDIVAVLESIERIHRLQTADDQINDFNKYHEFDLAVLIAFVEYYLKHTEPCDSAELIYRQLEIVREGIKNKSINDKYLFRIVHSYILDFFEELKDKKFDFDNVELLSLDEIIQAIQYIQKFNVVYFDLEGNPYIDIPINEKLKENIKYIKTLQKIFFDNEFDIGKEKFLRVFEYDLVNTRVGSSYKTISDGEKHFIRFAIDIIYHLHALKQYNFTPDKEELALFLADEPDNAMHPVWKKRLIDSALEIFDNYSEIPNITVHFIFTTHSPFLLSDIPKQNILFLDTFENGKCRVLNHDDVMEKNETFGANIHTLLSDSFFMSDGLIGEFARKKIQLVIDFLNDKEKILDRQKAWSIIQLIGEPFLKYKLEEMYHEKFSSDDEKRAARIKQLENELEELKNVKTED